MGVSLNQYRQSIGLFNNIKFVRCQCNIKCVFLPMLLLLLLVISILLIRAGVEQNPGPTTTKVKHLNVCHLNIRGLNASKLRAIETSLCTYDIITMSETFLSAATSNVHLTLHGYNEVLRRDRPTFGGGLAIYIKDSLSYKRLIDLDDINVEQMWLQVNTLQGKIMICVAYRPPHFNDFWHYMDDNFDHVKAQHPGIKYYMLLGDLNADFATVNGNHLKDLCASQNLVYHVDEPTRITENTQTCLDQIITNMPNFVRSVAVLPPVSTNDHCTVGCELNFKLPFDKAYSRHIWKYKDGDYENFREALRNAAWDDCFIDADVDACCDRWSTTFLNIARTYIPNKTVLVRPRDTPWFTNQLRNFRRKVHRLYKLAKQNPTANNWQRYKTNRGEYQDALDSAESLYRDKLAESLTQSRNTKSWWKTMKSMLGKGCDDSYPPMYDSENSTYVSDNRGKAQLINNFFLSHSKVDSSNVDLPPFEPITDLTLSDIEASHNDVYDLIKSLDVNKSSGHDGISARMLKEAGDSIVPSLTRLINLSLEHCIYPTTWKWANVIPLFKKGDKDNPNNYRPISVLPTVSKIAERIVFKHVYNYLHTNKLLSVNQSGFRPDDSTVNQLAYMYHMFCESLDKKKDIRIVYCDVSKAFDKVWHEGIVYKLRKIGITGKLLQWFENYLLERKQRVVINGQSSDYGVIEAGVPQGSVLGPLLFLIYINDLDEIVDCNIKMFADDTCLYISVDNPLEAAQSLNDNMNNVNNWAKQWIVNFNVNKTKAMTISNRRNDHQDILFDNTALENVDAHKHLGLILTSNLSWSAHIDSIVNNASKMVDVSRRIKYNIDRFSLETVYFSFVRPKLEYASQIWDDCNNKDKDKLENVQLNMARVVTGAKKGTSHELLYRELNWPLLSERRKIVKCQFMHKVVNKNVPEYLYELLPETVGKNVNYGLRNKNNLRQFPCRTEKFKKSLLPDCINMWNDIDDELRSIVDYDEFKSKLPPCNGRSCELYNYGQRKFNVIHSQLRMKCSNLKAHLTSLHVIDDPTCICNNGIEDSFHFFLSCPLYNNDRRTLVDRISVITNATIDIILYGDSEKSLEENQEIFCAVHQYIESSNRF